LNINTATAAELELLPGIGEVTAARIVAFRQENGPYRSIDDLIHVQGISTKTIASFREFVTVTP
jgi:competence protein ComEA